MGVDRIVMARSRVLIVCVRVDRSLSSWPGVVSACLSDTSQSQPHRLLSGLAGVEALSGALRPTAGPPSIVHRGSEGHNRDAAKSEQNDIVSSWQEVDIDIRQWQHTKCCAVTQQQRCRHVDAPTVPRTYGSADVLCDALCVCGCACVNANSIDKGEASPVRPRCCGDGEVRPLRTCALSRHGHVNDVHESPPLVPGTQPPVRTSLARRPRATSTETSPRGRDLHSCTPWNAALCDLLHYYHSSFAAPGLAPLPEMKRR